MFIVDVLKRKDAAAVIVAVALGLVAYNFISTIVVELSQKISSTSERSGGDIHSNYIYPVVSAVLQVVALELVIRLYVWAADALKK